MTRRREETMLPSRLCQRRRIILPQVRSKAIGQDYSPEPPATPSYQRSRQSSGVRGELFFYICIKRDRAWTKSPNIAPMFLYWSLLRSTPRNEDHSLRIERQQHSFCLIFLLLVRLRSSRTSPRIGPPSLPRRAWLLRCDASRNSILASSHSHRPHMIVSHCAFDPLFHTLRSTV